MTHGYYRPGRETGAALPWSRRKWWTLMLAGPVAWIIPAIVVVAVVGALGGFFYFPLGFETWGGGFEIIWPLPVPWVIAPFFTLALMMAVNRFFRSRRRQRGRVVLGYLENALRLNLPLPEFLVAAQISERGRTAREIAALRQRLMSGESVALAVQASVPGIPQEVVAQISAAEANGTLQQTFSRMEEEELRRFQNDLGGGGEEERSLFLRFYLPCVVSTLFILSLSWMIFVLPKFREIFKDFRMELPAVTERAMAISRFIGDSLPNDPLLLLLLIAPVFVLIGGQLQRMFVPAWPVPSFRWLYEFITWHTPFWRKMELDGGMARMCRVLSEGVRAGKTLPEAMVLALALPGNRYFRKRLLKWRVLVVRGRPAAQAAAEAGMPALLVGFLAAGEDARAASNSGMAEMLEFVARYYRGRVEHMALVLRAAAEPVSVMLIGAGVGTCVYAVILPLVHLINGVIGQYPEGALKWSLEKKRRIGTGHRRPRAFLTLDVLMGMGLALALLMALSALLARQAQGQRRLAAVRTAARRLEAAMLHLENGDSLEAGIDLRRLEDAAPAGQAWIRLTLPRSGTGSSALPELHLVGLLPAAKLAEMPAVNVERGMP